MNISQHETLWLQNKGAEMLQKLGIKKDDVVADFGCGEGRYVIPLTQAVGKNGKVYAVEHIDNAIDTIKSRVPLFVKNDNLQILKIENLQVEIDLPSESVDAILVFDVLQYIENKDLLFSCFNKALKSKGLVFIYPAAIPHPGDVNMRMITEKMILAGFEFVNSQKFTMMHSIDMVEDVVYTFSKI